ncbi:RloB family protein [Geminocystis herdmanii]|uniref:RloB family protein n=1 Tax=Geminocystis herdmanii TaxID=669359 RepID=UPI00034755BA|nr:RloB family protein [Geminocystis herdmanii]
MPQNKYSRKNINKRKPNKTFLIICEGETEKKYFDIFKTFASDKNILIEVKLGNKKSGAVGITVVKTAIDLKDEYYNDDEVWCVFDRDAKKENNNQQNFNQAIEFAYNNQINLAISNDAFELWFLLHYEYYCSETHRSNLNKLLTDRLGKKYEKNDDIYNQLEDKQENAIKNAKKLWFSHCKEKEYDSDNLSVYEQNKIHNMNPSTTVYQLVEKLREVIGIK